jgi:hypothetical protein
MAQNERVDIDLTAKDDASKTIDKVADKAEDLEKLSPEVDVTADTSQAQRAVTDVREEVQALTRADAEILLRAKVDAARAELKSLQTELKETTDAAETTNRQLADTGAGPAADDVGRLADESGRARSAMANMTGNVAGELGAISGAGGIAAQSLGELAEAAAEGELSMAGLAKVAGPMAGLAAAMTVMQEAMKAAEASRIFDAEKVKRYSDAIAKGEDRVEALAEQIDELNQLQYRAPSGGGLLGLFSTTKDLIPILRDAEISFEQFNDMVRQFPTRSVDEWRESLYRSGVELLDASAIVKAAKDEFENWNTAILQTTESFVFLAGGIDNAKDIMRGLVDGVGTAIDTAGRWAREQYDAAAAAAEAEKRTKALKDEVLKLDEKLRNLQEALNFEQALNSFEDAWWEAMSGAEGEVVTTEDEVLALKQTILDLGETAKTNPAVIEAQLKAVDRGDLVAVANDIQNYYARYPPSVTVKPVWGPGATSSLPGGRWEPYSMPPPAVPVPAPVTVNMTMPRGIRPDDVVRAVDRYARRNGRTRAGR